MNSSAGNSGSAYMQSPRSVNRSTGFVSSGGGRNSQSVSRDMSESPYSKDSRFSFREIPGSSVRQTSPQRGSSNLQSRSGSRFTDPRIKSSITMRKPSGSRGFSGGQNSMANKSFNNQSFNSFSNNSMQPQGYSQNSRMFGPSFVNMSQGQSYGNPQGFYRMNENGDMQGGGNYQDSGMCSMICSTRADKPQLDSFMDAIESTVIDLEHQYVDVLEQYGVPAEKLDLTFVNRGKKYCEKCKKQNHPESLNKDAGCMIASFENMQGEIDKMSRHLQNVSFDMIAKECTSRCC